MPIDAPIDPPSRYGHLRASVGHWALCARQGLTVGAAFAEVEAKHSEHVHFRAVPEVKARLPNLGSHVYLIDLLSLVELQVCQCEFLQCAYRSCDRVTVHWCWSIAAIRPTPVSAIN
jgi:hypothetical protein